MGWGCCQGLGVALCSWMCSCLGLGIIQGEAVQGHFQYEYVKRVLKRGIMTGALGCLGFWGIVLFALPCLWQDMGLCSEQGFGASAP